MKIIITGGAGFIGSAVIRQYINDTDHEVINLDALRKEYVENYKADNINMSTHPLMRRYCDDTCCPNIHEEIARVAAVSCLHSCIQVRILTG